MNIDRRSFLAALAAAYPLSSAHAEMAFPIKDVAVSDRLKAMLIGSLIGDALGGPLEFATEEVRAGRVAGCRD